jgi:hemerythrin
MKFAGLIPLFRERAGLSIAEAAQVVGLPVNVYMRYEAGDPDIPLWVLDRIAASFDITVQTLLLGGGSPQVHMHVVYRPGKEIEVEQVEDESTADDNGGKALADYAKFIKTDDLMTTKISKRKEPEQPDTFMMTRKILDWQGASTGMNFFDGPQKEFITMANALYAANLTGGWKYSRKFFEQTLRHAQRYFRTDMRSEELIMEKVLYPDYKTHKAEHILFLKEIVNQVERYKANQPIDVKGFVIFLKDWVLSHMGISDRSFGLYLTKLKREGSLAKIIMQVKRTPDNRVIVREKHGEQGIEIGEE